MSVNLTAFLLGYSYPYQHIYYITKCQKVKGVTMNCAIYARVSTTAQAEKGYSLETQVEACKKKAIELGADTIKEYLVLQLIDKYRRMYGTIGSIKKAGICLTTKTERRT